VGAHRRSSPHAERSADPQLQWFRLVDGEKRRREEAPAQRTPSVRRLVVGFLVANVCAAALLLGGSLWAGYQIARNESLADARSTTGLLASLWIEPQLSDAVLAGDLDALARLDRVVTPQLSEISATRVKIWTADGRIVYSDEPRLIGRRFALEGEDLETLREGGSTAEVSDVSRPENAYEPGQGKLVEVYQRITATSGEPLLLELYYPYDLVSHREMTVWLTTVPVSVGAFVLLLLVQLPLARRMVRRIRQADRERSILHGRAADASSDERRRIAGALHDGVVQDLSAAAMLMATRLDRLQAGSPDRRELEELSGDLTAATGAVRQEVTSLRSLLIEIYPPHRDRAGLSVALRDLADQLAQSGVRTAVDVNVGPDLPAETAGLVFRVAQEGVLNIARHANARSARLVVRQEGRVVRMEIHDDGVGFDPAASAPAGHFGMQVLADLTEDAGGTLDLASAPGRGTHVRLQVPVPDRAADLVADGAHR